MDEKDKELQLLRKRLEVVTEENDALMGELYALKECDTCIHKDERNEHCDGIHHMWCPENDGYNWRGVSGYNEWLQEQETLRRLEAESEAEEEKFRKGLEE